MRKHIILLLLATFSFADLDGIGSGFSAISFGPNMHWYFGSKVKTVSFGFEASYWYITDIGLPVSVDVGFDAVRRKGNATHYLVYSELQTGFFVTGFSMGPVVNLTTKTIGGQMSLWGNIMLGADARFRFLNGEKLFSPGLMLKTCFLSLMMKVDGFSECDLLKSRSNIRAGGYVIQI